MSIPYQEVLERIAEMQVPGSEPELMRVGSILAELNACALNQQRLNSLTKKQLPTLCAEFGRAISMAQAWIRLARVSIRNYPESLDPHNLITELYRDYLVYGYAVLGIDRRRDGQPFPSIKDPIEFQPDFSEPYYGDLVIVNERGLVVVARDAHAQGVAVPEIMPRAFTALIILDFLFQSRLGPLSLPSAIVQDIGYGQRRAETERISWLKRQLIGFQKFFYALRRHEMSVVKWPEPFDGLSWNMIRRMQDGAEAKIQEACGVPLLPIQFGLTAQQRTSRDFLSYLAIHVDAILKAFEAKVRRALRLLEFEVELEVPTWGATVTRLAETGESLEIEGESNANPLVR